MTEDLHRTRNSGGGRLALLALSFLAADVEAAAAPGEVQPFVAKYCARCHSGKEVNGGIDLAAALDFERAPDGAFKTWKRAADAVARKSMPPDDEPQPSSEERAALLRWYAARFESAAAEGGEFRVRRLSTLEYRRTLETLLGFPLQSAVAASEQTRSEPSLVLKLMPVDPRGDGGFTNDTHGQPMSPLLWSNYCHLADVAVQRLFGAEGRPVLEKTVGPIPADGMDAAQAARFLKWFQARAWRRAVEPSQSEPLLRNLAGKAGAELQAALKREVEFLLLSPEFLYRGFLAGPLPGSSTQVDDFELAERLSYFLWSDMPDDALSAAAARGGLGRDEVYAEQVRRMLQAPAARSLAEIFAVQWLALDEIDHATNELAYNASLKGQPIEFLHDLLVRDRPLVELIDSRVEYVNLYLIDYYRPDQAQLGRVAQRAGVEREVVPLERFVLKATPGRGGLLVMPGVLTMNKTPIQRGAWMLERILGDHVGDPPPDVPPIKPSAAGRNLTFRERFAAHRSNRACAACHDRIDPLGFAFSAYHENGAYLLAGDAAKQRVGKTGSGVKQADLDRSRIDASGTLPTGERFADFEELRTLLKTTLWPRVVENLVRRTLSYGLCRGLQQGDEPAVREMTRTLSRPGATWGDLVLQVAKSVPFREARFSASKTPLPTSSTTKE